MDISTTITNLWNRTNKRQLKRAAVILVGLFLLFQLFNLIRLGSVKITTDAPDNDITLSTSSGKQVKKATGKLSIRVSPGQYIVMVEGKKSNLGTGKEISVRAHHSQKHDIKLSTPATVEPVLPEGAAGIRASNASVSYISTQTNNILQSDPAGDIQDIGGGLVFQKIQWANSGFGVGLSIDSQLYVVEGGSIRPTPRPTTTSGGAAINYALSPNKHLYVSVGRDIYKKSDIDNGTYQKIYTYPADSFLLVAGNDGVIIVDGSASKKGTQALADGNQLITVLDNGEVVRNKALKLSPSGITSSVALSPNSKYLAVGAAASKILDSNLRPVATLPTLQASNPVWQNDNTLLFNASQQIWSYDLKTKTATHIAHVGIDQQIDQLAVSDDGAYVYVSISNSNGNIPTIGRLGLRQQPVADFIYSLDVFFPAVNDNGCTLGYANIVHPVITLTTFGSQQDCRDTANDIIAQDRLPADSFTYQFTPGTSAMSADSPGE